MPRAWGEAPIDTRRLLRAFSRFRSRGWLAGARDIVIIADTERQQALRYVNTHPHAREVCDCGDHVYREVLCMHALAALLWLNDERVVQALGAAMRDAWLDRAPQLPVPQFQNGVRVG